MHALPKYKWGAKGVVEPTSGSAYCRSMPLIRPSISEPSRSCWAVANLRLSGFFRLVSNWVVAKANHSLVVLAALVLVAGTFSAFLVNDAICLVLTPVVLDLVKKFRRDPVPYLLATAMASNVGSTATITGNPQNMIIGSVSHLSYGSFAAALSPIAACGLVLTILLIALIHPREFFTRKRLEPLPQRPPRYHGPLVVKSVLVTAAMMVLFFAGASVPIVAIVGGALLLLTRSIKSTKVYLQIDWPLLLMFVGLFIVIAAVEHAVLSPQAIAAIGRLHLSSMRVLAALTAALSNLVSNVPAVLVLKPFVMQRPWRPHAKDHRTPNLKYLHLSA
jgi:Na+/H+ antiporter NhaD/arsenite permease-like protein